MFPCFLMLSQATCSQDCVICWDCDIWVIGQACKSEVSVWLHKLFLICCLFNDAVCKSDCIVLNAWMIESNELEGIWKEAVMYAEGSCTLMYHPRNCLDGLRKTKKSLRTMSKLRFKPNNYRVPSRSMSKQAWPQAVPQPMLMCLL